MDDIKAIWLKKIDEKVACKNMKEGGFSPALIVATSFHCGEVGWHWQLKIVSAGQGICLPMDCIVAI